MDVAIATTRGAIMSQIQEQEDGLLLKAAEQAIAAASIAASLVYSRTRSNSTASSVASSELSDLENDEEQHKVSKKRKYNRPTPDTSVDEPITKKKVVKVIDRTRLPFPEAEVADRKDYLQAGLYTLSRSAQPASSRLQKRKKEHSQTVSKPIKLSAKTIEAVAHKFQWGLPLHHGEAILEQKRTFRLPWDILNDFDLSRLPDSVEGVAFRADALDRLGKQKVPTAYKTISQNKYTERLRDEAEIPAICFCTSGGCDDSCINRMMQYFCSPKLCPLGSKCTNVPFNLRKVRHDLEVVYTGNRGFGLRTNSPIVAGEFIMEYRGEIISINESYRRVANEYKNRHDYYFLDYYGAEVVDAGLQGNESRFINHSCDPNVHVVRWKLADYDEYQIGFFALRDIDAKEELCYDYGWQSFSSIDTKKDQEDKEEQQVKEPKQQLCLCASAKCSGFLEKKASTKAPVVTVKKSASVSRKATKSANKKK